MVARFLYRLVSLFFFTLALVCWFLAASAIAAQIALGFNLGAFGVSFLSPIFAFMAHQASIEAWRAARYHHVSY